MLISVVSDSVKLSALTGPQNIDATARILTARMSPISRLVRRMRIKLDTEAATPRVVFPQRDFGVLQFGHLVYDREPESCAAAS